MERLRLELERYRQEQEQLRQTKARVLIMEERLRDLHWEDEVCNTVHSTRQPFSSKRIASLKFTSGLAFGQQSDLDERCGVTRHPPGDDTLDTHAKSRS